MSKIHGISVRDLLAQRSHQQTDQDGRLHFSRTRLRGRQEEEASLILAGRCKVTRGEIYRSAHDIKRPKASPTVEET